MKDTSYTKGFTQFDGFSRQLLCRKVQREAAAAAEKALSRKRTNYEWKDSQKPAEMTECLTDSYEFIVIKLQVPSDFDKGGKLIEEPTLEVELSFKLELPLDHDGNLCFTQVFLNEKLSKLMTITNNTEVLIYKNNPVKGTTEVTWEFPKRVENYPQVLQGAMHHNYLFSGNFKYMINFTYSEYPMFYIQRTDKPNKDDKKYVVLNSLLSFSRGEENKSLDQVRALAKRMRLVERFEKDTMVPYLHLINKEGLEVMIKVKELPTLKEVNNHYEGEFESRGCCGKKQKPLRDTPIECYGRVDNF